VLERPGVLGPVLVAPAILYIAALVGYPFFLAIYLSMSNADVSTSGLGRFVGVDNFLALFESSVFFTALRIGVHAVAAPTLGTWTFGLQTDRRGGIDVWRLIPSGNVGARGVVDPRRPPGQQHQVVARVVPREDLVGHSLVEQLDAKFERGQRLVRGKCVTFWPSADCSVAPKEYSTDRQLWLPSLQLLNAMPHGWPFSLSLAVASSKVG
jgi:hypothetical protein